MNRPAHKLLGASIAASWTPIDHGDLGLIAVPEALEPIVLEWRAYACPEDPLGEPAYLGRFTYGACTLAVSERARYSIVGSRGVATFRGRCHRTEHPGCGELVHWLAAGRELPLARFASGAYRGAWYSDVAYSRESREAPGWVETRACRTIFLLEQAKVLLFRSLTLARAGAV